MFAKLTVAIIGFALLLSCTSKKDDPFYLLEGNAIEVLESANEKFELSISVIPEETTTLHVDLTEFYTKSDIEKIKKGDQISKKSESYDLIIRRDGAVIDTLHGRKH